MVQYRSTSDKLHKYLVRYAELGSFAGERHNYLKCWVDEPNKHADIEELVHNYTLSFNRIFLVLDYCPMSNGGMKGRHEGFDKILVEFTLNGSWVNGYESRVEDITPRPPLIDGRLCIAQYVSFWHFFKRDIIQYSAGCKVVSSSRAVELMRAEISKMLANY